MTQDDDRPLARFGGARPPAPGWYDDAMARLPAFERVMVEGAAIEWRGWGPVGSPGLLLVHGGAAHAGWWSHVAPLLAQGRRVAALSLSGMGGSDWRSAYSIVQYGRELRAVAAAAGLDRAGPPVIVGHSFGCAPVVAALAAGWPGGGILIDGSVTMKPGDPPRRSHRRTVPFATVEAGLARFRLLPAQPSRNPFVLDGIARASLTPRDGGFIWSFDPDIYGRCTFIDARATLRGVRLPVTIIRGERSTILSADALDVLKRDVPGLRSVTIPDAGHHVMVDQPIALVAAIAALLAG